VDALSSLAVTAERTQRRRLAIAAREVITKLVVTTAGADELADAAERLEEICAYLGELPAGQAYEGFSEAANAGSAMLAMMTMLGSPPDPDAPDPDAPGSDARDPNAEAHCAVPHTGSGDSPENEWFAFFDQSPLSGLSNPLSPPLVLSYDPADSNRLRGEVNFGTAYEGPPGFVHGGYVAAVFDELLGATQSLSGTQGMTAHLGIDYRSPTPLGKDLVMHGWVEGIEGKKIRSRATLQSGDRLCAEAYALFIAIEPGGFKEMLDAREV
jgi:acyl-coenzyme A thioesterase PaaI-like protein